MDQMESQKPKNPMSSIIEITLRILSIAICAYIGVFVRVMLTTLSKLASTSVLSQIGASFFLPNIFGTFILGLFNGKLSERMKKSGWKELHVGITSGFCGSCTTFATWTLHVSVLFLHTKWLDSILLSLLTFTTSYMAFLCGRHVSELVANFIDTDIQSEKGQVTPKSPILVAAGVFLLLTVAIWSGSFLDPSNTRNKWWIAVAFGPFGALIRYFLSLQNRRFPNFPLFTLIANIAGATGDISFLVLGNYGMNEQFLLPEYKMWAMSGISTGFMGSLSTVSTWIGEICKFNQGQKTLAYGYGVVTVSLGHLISIFIGGMWIICGNQLISL